LTERRQTRSAEFPPLESKFRHFISIVKRYYWLRRHKRFQINYLRSRKILAHQLPLANPGLPKEKIWVHDRAFPIIVGLSLEDPMSNAHANAPRPIPTGILVWPVPRRAKVERPAPKRKAARHARGRQVPWLWLVTSGSVACAAVILTIALYAERRKLSQPTEPATMVRLIEVSASGREPAVQEPVTAPEAVEPAVESEPKPIGDAPKLPMRNVHVPRDDQLPPAIPIDLETVKHIILFCLSRIWKIAPFGLV
jgi:hypothetical protein